LEDPEDWYEYYVFPGKDLKIPLKPAAHQKAVSGMVKMANMQGKKVTHMFHVRNGVTFPGRTLFVPLGHLSW
jgi:hypothetical protein